MRVAYVKNKTFKNTVSFYNIFMREDYQMINNEVVIGRNRTNRIFFYLEKKINKKKKRSEFVLGPGLGRRLWFERGQTEYFFLHGKKINKKRKKRHGFVLGPGLGRGLWFGQGLRAGVRAGGCGHGHDSSEDWDAL